MEVTKYAPFRSLAVLPHVDIANPEFVVLANGRGTSAPRGAWKGLARCSEGARQALEGFRGAPHTAIGALGAGRAGASDGRGQKRDE